MAFVSSCKPIQFTVIKVRITGVYRVYSNWRFFLSCGKIPKWDVSRFGHQTLRRGFVQHFAHYPEHEIPLGHWLNIQILSNWDNLQLVNELTNQSTNKQDNCRESHKEIQQNNIWGNDWAGCYFIWHKGRALQRVHLELNSEKEPVKSGAGKELICLTLLTYKVVSAIVGISCGSVNFCLDNACSPEIAVRIPRFWTMESNKCCLSLQGSLSQV